MMGIRACVYVRESLFLHISHILGFDIDTVPLIERIPFDYNNYGEIEFMESDILLEYCRNKAEHNLDSILYKKNFIKAQLEYGNTVIYNGDKGQKKTTTERS